MGERINSPVLLANAWHHRSDAMSSVVALVGIGGACLGFPLLDPIAGICVAGMVAMTGVVSWFVCLFDEKCSKVPRLSVAGMDGHICAVRLID